MYKYKINNWEPNCGKPINQSPSGYLIYFAYKFSDKAKVIYKEYIGNK